MRNIMVLTQPWVWSRRLPVCDESLAIGPFGQQFAVNGAGRDTIDLDVVSMASYGELMTLVLKAFTQCSTVSYSTDASKPFEALETK